MTKVSVVVPTLNAGKTLDACLYSVLHQTAREVETIIVDAQSTDQTSRIGKHYGKVISADVGMTEGRYLGVLASTGDFVLNLDADQVLAPTAIERAVSANKPMVLLGERGTGRGLIANLSRVEKQEYQASWQSFVDPANGPLRPRFYRREVLRLALGSIPQSIRRIRPCPFSEDTLIFSAASRIASGVGFVPDAVSHQEEESLIRYARKWAAYGKAASQYRGTTYEWLVRSRGRSRMRSPGSVAGILMLLIRSGPFFAGYYI